MTNESPRKKIGFSHAVHKICKKPKRKPDRISYDRWGNISSQYWFGEDKKGRYVIRESDHWSQYQVGKNIIDGCGNIGTCFWPLKVYHILNNKMFSVKGHTIKVVGDVCGKAYMNKFDDYHKENRKKGEGFYRPNLRAVNMRRKSHELKEKIKELKALYSETVIT